MDEVQIEPSEFDLIVIGTGLVESIVAAAAAIAGRSVLQLDPSDHYGGSWATLRLDELAGMLAPAAAADDDDTADADADRAAAAGIRQDSAQVWQAPGTELGPSRQYSLDLAPKVAYGAGPLIQLLLGSGAHNYLEFKLVQGSYLLDLSSSSSSSSSTMLRSVPSSRSEVFKDRQLSPLQKRSLMRFLKAAAEALEGEGPLKDAFGEQPIRELLEQQGLDQQLQQSLVYGVLLADSCASNGSGRAGAPGNAASRQQQQEEEEEEQQQQQQQEEERGMSAAEALARLRLFVQSAGRYGAGTGPFLTPLYGCGELPQAFSRVAAVAGAVQVLRSSIAGLSFDEHTFSCIGVELASGQNIRCQHLAGNEAALADWLCTFHPAASMHSTRRCCAILDGPLVPGEQHTMVAVLPAAAASGAAAAAGASGSAGVVRALSLSSSTAVCPPGKQLLYLWADAGGSGVATSSQQPTAAEALWPALAALTDTSSLQVQPASCGNGATLSIAAPAAGTEESGAAGSRGGGDTVKPAALWAAFYSQDSRQLLSDGLAAGSGGRWPTNVALCPGPDSSATFASAVEAAKQCYWQLFPAQSEGAAFPLDVARPSEEGASGEGDSSAAADADSDDEAVAALQAALRQVSTQQSSPEVVGETEQPVGQQQPE